jgi:hypothetical protein
VSKPPYYIRAVIDAYTLPEPEINAGIIEELVRDGLVELTPAGNAKTTDRGAVYIRLLRDVPLPEKAWIDPRTIKALS